MQEIAKVTHYFSNIGVAVIKLSKALKVGDTIQFKGATTDFEQEIESMQVDHENIPEAKKGDEVGLKVKEKVRVGDKVLKKE
ncbi:MAG: translation elongation factor-like protein [bacterium]